MLYDKPPHHWAGVVSNFFKNHTDGQHTPVVLSDTLLLDEPKDGEALLQKNHGLCLIDPNIQAATRLGISAAVHVSPVDHAFVFEDGVNVNLRD